MGSPADQPASPSLRERQSLLTKCLGALLQYAGEQNLELTLGEGFVQTPRKTRDGKLVADGVHQVNSLHYVRLAQDLCLFIDGVYISDGSHPAWKNLGEYWEALSPGDTSWGGRFPSMDSNHFEVRR